MIFFSIMLLNPFTVSLNNNDVRQITAELVESEMTQKHKQSCINAHKHKYKKELLCLISNLIYYH